MTKFRFKPEDFSGYYKHITPSDAMANIANELLDKAIAEAPVVYGDRTKVDWTVDAYPADTYKSVLFNIEEIAKKDCEHEPSYTLSGITQAGNSSILTNVAAKIVCSKCGISLKARWEAAE
jgi:hypothetical protein